MSLSDIWIWRDKFQEKVDKIAGNYYSQFPWDLEPRWTSIKKWKQKYLNYDRENFPLPWTEFLLEQQWEVIISSSSKKTAQVSGQKNHPYEIYLQSDIKWSLK